MLSSVSQLADQAKTALSPLENPSPKTDKSDSFEKCLRENLKEPGETKKNNAPSDSQTPGKNELPASEAGKARHLTEMERFLYDLVYRDPSTWSIADRESYHIDKSGRRLRGGIPQTAVQAKPDGFPEKFSGAVKKSGALPREADARENSRDNEILAGQESQVSGMRQKSLFNVKTSLREIEKQSRVTENEIVRELVKAVSFRKLRDGSNVQLVLKPGFLGEISLDLAVKGDQVTAVFVTKNAAAQEVLTADLKTLREALMKHGLRIRSLEVTALDSGFPARPERGKKIS